MSHEQDLTAVGAGNEITETPTGIDAERRARLALSLLQILNRPNDLSGNLHDLLNEIVTALDLTGAAIRLADGDDFTFREQVGLPEAFVQQERSLLSPGSAGEGCLACMCGRILEARCLTGRPYYTSGGSFWTADLKGLLAEASDEEREMFTRGTCLREGFASMALVPLRSGDEVAGLLQFVDRRPGRLDASSVAFLEEAAAGIGVAVRRRRDEEKLRRHSEEVLEANERLKLLVEGSPRFFFYVQELDGSLSYVSPSVEAVTGRPADAWLGQEHWFTTANPVNDRARKRTGQHLAGTIDSRPIHCEIEHADGRPILLEVFEFGRYRDGRLVGIHGIAHDLTEERRAAVERDRLFEHSAEMLCVADLDGRFRQLNPAWQRTLGWTADELLARPYIELVHPDDRGITHGAERDLIQAREVHEFVNRYRCKDGSYRWLSWKSFPLPEEGLVFAVARDVTELRQAAETERRQLRQLAAVNRIARQTASQTDLDELLRTTVKEIHEQLGYHSVGILAVNREANQLCFGKMAGAYARIARPDYSQSLDVGILGLAARSGRTVLCNDVAADPRYEIGFDEDPGTGAEIGVPVVVDGEVVAVIDVHEKQADAFSEADVTTLETVADQLAVAIKNVRLLDQATKSEERYRVLFESESDAVFLIDNSSGRLLEANAAAEAMYGYSREELLRLHNVDLSAEPEDTERVTSTASGRATVPLRWHKKADGTVFPVEITGSFFEFQGRPVHIAAIRDISERLRTEQQLRASEERYRKFFEDDLTADFIATVEGELVECNPAFAEIFGFDSVEQATTCDLATLYPSVADRQRFLTRLRQERSLKYFELELRRRDGTPVHVVENAYGVFDEHGELVQIKGYLFDITGHKKTEEQLRHAQKMEAMGRLAGGVAHDFNNLLQAMLSTLQYLRLSGADPEASLAAVGELEEHVRRGAGLSRQLLLFARRGVTRPEKLDLNDVVVEAARLLARVAPANVHLAVSYADGPLVLDGDRGQLEQVLTNLVLNAADAMPAGGRLEVRTWASNGDIGVSVADTGTGMDEATRARIFEPFFTTKGARGTGLGLSVVHGIVAHHGGRLEVESAPGAGTTFRVSFPRHASGVFPAVRETAATQESISGGAERVLVVEDNPQIRDLFARMLERLGYRVTAVGSAEDALALEREPEFELLLTDVMLPGITGVEMSRMLSERWPELRVILMSGYAEDEVVRRDITAGQVRFLQKPVDLATLADEVRASLGGGTS